MTEFHSPFADVALKDQSITERVFAGLRGRPNEVVLIDGGSGHAFGGWADGRWVW